jgi:hypothetical protein
MKLIGKWLKDHPKLTSAIVAAALAAGAAYGVHPALSQQALDAISRLLGM